MYRIIGTSARSSRRNNAFDSTERGRSTCAGAPRARARRARDGYACMPDAGGREHLLGDFPVGGHLLQGEERLQRGRHHRLRHPGVTVGLRVPLRLGRGRERRQQVRLVPGPRRAVQVQGEPLHRGGRRTGLTAFLPDRPRPGDQGLGRGRDADVRRGAGRADVHARLRVRRRSATRRSSPPTRR